MKVSPQCNFILWGIDLYKEIDKDPFIKNDIEQRQQQFKLFFVNTSEYEFI